MKARGTLLMALPNKDQLKFHSYKDAKLLMEAIEKRYGGNKESKKVQRTLLKQQYENFIGSSSETMDQTFDRLQKLITQLEIQEDLVQIDPDDLEVMDLHWVDGHLTLESFEEKNSQEDRQEVGCKLGQRVRFDRTKVECYNCHKYGHFAENVKLLGNQKTEEERLIEDMNMKLPLINAWFLKMNWVGLYDWSYQAEEEHPTNFALMPHTSSGISSSSDSKVDSCSKSCVKAYATSKT
ncbi:ribonuclease H-like domain-containing protein [Tanacetum coccineum]